MDKDDLDRKSNTVKLVFPSVFTSARSTLILKEPKSEASTRIIWLPSTVARHMNELKEQQEQQKAFLGKDYKDYDLVMAMEDGRPLEGSVLNDHLQIIIKKYGLPPVTFHSLRHTSTTYKLKISGGDVKSVQGDTGHADAKLVMDTYAEIMDADRRVGAQHFEAQFFQGARKVEPALIAPDQQPEPAVSANDLVDLLGLLTSNPELLHLLKSQASVLQTAGQ
ncbi:tyrosine-type recombinase/integrase [Ruminococcaceae bacterium OttesenSCG-928-A16]|nr:tyrosine-type recombinase/integrase [Ruminococcaceae bacterium OttesenSCG-928-A16]